MNENFEIFKIYLRLITGYVVKSSSCNDLAELIFSETSSLVFFSGSSALLGTRASKPFVAYKGGVLGLIPLPDAKSGTHTDFPRKESNITMSRKSLGNNKSVLVRSIATQTVSVPKAIFMARRNVQSDDTVGPSSKKPDKYYQTPLRPHF